MFFYWLSLRKTKCTININTVGYIIVNIMCRYIIYGCCGISKNKYIDYDYFKDKCCKIINDNKLLVFLCIITKARMNAERL